MIGIENHRRVLALAALFAGLALSGCAGALVGGVATTGVVIAQERSVGSAIDD